MFFVARRDTKNLTREQKLLLRLTIEIDADRTSDKNSNSLVPVQTVTLKDAKVDLEVEYVKLNQEIRDVDRIIERFWRDERILSELKVTLNGEIQTGETEISSQLRNEIARLVMIKLADVFAEFFAKRI